jgi:hypothetical protein
MRTAVLSHLFLPYLKWGLNRYKNFMEAEHNDGLYC